MRAAAKQNDAAARGKEYAAAVACAMRSHSIDCVLYALNL
jgi:hypothetical protein